MNLVELNSLEINMKVAGQSLLPFIDFEKVLHNLIFKLIDHI